MTECPECGRECTKKITTTCRACYQKKRHVRMQLAVCHPDRKEHAAGFCRPCYRAGGRASKALCHTDRLQVARGLCPACYAKDPDTKEREKASRRQRKYGLSSEAHARMFEEQAGKCAICRDAAASMVDHDHATGEVRGLLCRACNYGLGNFKDSLERLNNAIRYLNSPRSVVPNVEGPSILAA